MGAFVQTLRNRNLLILGFSVVVSLTGSWITMMAVLSMMIFRGGGGVSQSSGIFIAGLVPVIIFSPLAGWLCDRFDRKWLMISSELLSGLAVCGLVFFKEGWIIYALLALQAAFGSLMIPARQAVLPVIVSKDQLTNANAFMQQLVGVIKIFVPGLAGFLLLWVSPQTAIILDVISYVLSAVILLKLPPLRVESDSDSEKVTQLNRGKQLESGSVWHVLGNSLQLRMVFISIFLGIFCIIGFDVLASVFVRDEMGAEEGFYGLLISLIGLGTLIGTWILVFRKKPGNYWQDVMVGLALISLIPLAPALVSLSLPSDLQMVVLVLGNFLGGVGSGVVTVQVYTLLQILSPENLLGRISGAFESVFTAGQFAGMVLTPLVVPGLLPIGTFFFVSTLAILCLVVCLGWVLYREQILSPV